MPISVKVLNDQIKKVSKYNTLLDMLIAFEEILDDSDIYIYDNWIDGEILEGPTVDRHWVKVSLLYPYKKMPDPDGAKRLIAKGCLVEYKKDKLKSPVKIKSMDDLEVSIMPDGESRLKTKTKIEPIWVVTVSIPRRFVDDMDMTQVKIDDEEYLDMEAISNASQNSEDDDDTDKEEK